MNITRTVIRFAIILVFLVLLVFLSITLFKLIPIGINQLATSSLSLGNPVTDTKPANMDSKVSQPVATTTGGLNGVITQNIGDIVISEPKPIVTNTSNTGKVNTVVKTVYVEKPIYYPQTTYYPTYVTPRVNGLKNVKATLTALGVIDRNSIFCNKFI
jgi:hypothetical protein